MRMLISLMVAAVPALGADPITVKRDPPLQIVWYSPRNPPKTGNAFTNGVIWWCYPEISQTFKRDSKSLLLNIQMVSTSPLIIVFAPVTLSIDGDVVLIEHTQWTLGRGIGGNVAKSVITGHDDVIRKVAKAKEVYVTVTGTTRNSIQLSDKQIAVFAEMIDKFDEIEPR